MYAKLCSIEILPNYLKEVSVGDILTIRALIANPLDWSHFYEKIITIHDGEKTDFTIVTDEGDRLMGHGDVLDIEKWSGPGNYGFRIKLKIRKQKSLSDRRVRGHPKTKKLKTESPGAISEIPSPTQKNSQPAAHVEKTVQKEYLPVSVVNQ